MPTTSAIDNSSDVASKIPEYNHEFTKETLNRVVLEPSIPIVIHRHNQLLHKIKTSQGNEKQVPEQLIDTGLDVCRVSFELFKRNRFLNEQLIIVKSRALLEYFQFYLSQCKERSFNISDQFETYLSSLKPKERVNWREFNKTLDINCLQNDVELGKFISIVFGSSYSNLSQCIHSLNVDDIKSFQQAVVNTECEIFKKYKKQWIDLASFIERRYTICKNQRDKLMTLKRIL